VWSLTGDKNCIARTGRWVARTLGNSGFHSVTGGAEGFSTSRGQGASFDTAGALRFAILQRDLGDAYKRRRGHVFWGNRFGMDNNDDFCRCLLSTQVDIRMAKEPMCSPMTLVNWSWEQASSVCGNIVNDVFDPPLSIHILGSVRQTPLPIVCGESVEYALQ
jgi:hypothetical protein